MPVTVHFVERHMSTDTASLESSPDAVRFGAFIVQRAISEAASEVIGAGDGSFRGVPGLAHFASMPDSPDAQAQLEVRLAKLRHLSHAALCPILDSGVVNSTAYWVHAVPDGEPLSTKSDQERWPITRVSELMTRLGSALQIAHELGLSHGAITAAQIFLRADGSPLLTGLGIAGQGPAGDQRDLARIAIELLAERPWLEIEADAGGSSDVRERRAQLLREALSMYTLRVVNVLAEATDPDPARQFPSVRAFAADFDSAIRLSAEDLVHGAYEAISARNTELARVMADKAESYDPQSDSLALLKIQLHGGSPFNQSGLSPLPEATTDLALTSADGDNAPISAPPILEQPGASRTMLPPELTEGLPQEFLDAIAPQFQVKPVKKGVNPLFVLAMGGAGLLLLLAAAGLATILLTGN